jgi:hypothetical protein
LAIQKETDFAQKKIPAAFFKRKKEMKTFLTPENIWLL